MAHLTKLTTYNIEDSNIALLGSDLEKRVREHAGDSESSWKDAGSKPGLEIWRIEKFNVVRWPQERFGSFYDGDSYIVLQTYKKTPESEKLSYNLHFWLGDKTTQDEAGTAAYKTVELDDHLHGQPVQFREIQNFETTQFLSYFPRFTSLQGGVSTGFHHVSDPPPLNIRKLYRVTLSRRTSSHGSGRTTSTLVVREVPADAASLVAADTYVLDKGEEVWQLNTKGSVGQEKYKAAEFAQSLVNERKGQPEVVVFDEGGSGSYRFLNEFGEGTDLLPSTTEESMPTELKLFRLSDASGKITFTPISSPSRQSLSSQDAFLLDHSSSTTKPAVYAWIGKHASLTERRLAAQYAQHYLYGKEGDVNHAKVAIPIVKMEEGNESDDFLDAFEA